MSRTGRSDKDDEDLTLYQLHCRYAILGGLDMPAAAALWQEVRPLGLSRDDHMSVLLDRLASSSPMSLDESRSPVGAAAIEGRKHLEEVIRRDRSPLMSACRLELDGYRCQYCGFRAPQAVEVSGASVLLRSPVLEVHHVKPIQDGARRTILTDLVTLCPTCHRLLHAIGRAIGSEELPVTLLKTSNPGAVSSGGSE